MPLLPPARGVPFSQTGLAGVATSLTYELLSPTLRLRHTLAPLPATLAPPRPQPSRAGHSCGNRILGGAKVGRSLYREDVPSDRLPNRSKGLG